MVKANILPACLVTVPGSADTAKKRGHKRVDCRKRIKDALLVVLQLVCSAYDRTSE